MEKLEPVPTPEELSKAINNLACGKAPGNDRISPDLFKRCKPTLLPVLVGGQPTRHKDAKITTLYKNKGDRCITIKNYQLEVIHQFSYLGSTITDNLSMDAKINKRMRG